MANLKAIRARIVSVRSTRQITSAMKMVAAAKLRKAQDKIIRLRPYANKLQEILSGLSQSLADSQVENVYGRISEPEKVLIVVITSNKGLCGAFNTNVIKETKRLISEYGKNLKCCDIRLLTIGKKGYDYFRKQPVALYGEQNCLLDNVTFANISQTAEVLMNSFAAGEFDRIEIVYNQFKNAAVQNLMTELFLPVTLSENDDKEKISSTSVDYIYEPSVEEIVKNLIPKSLKIQFYKAILDSFVAENGARMTAMHKATDNASTMIRELTLQYNKERQASITNQILEVVSGAEALK